MMRFLKTWLNGDVGLLVGYKQSLMKKGQPLELSGCFAYMLTAP